MAYINEIFHYWIICPWYIAVAMSTTVNILVYVAAAYSLEALTAKLIKNGYGSYIDSRTLNINQKFTEVANGTLTCLIFSFTSLITREFFKHTWPDSLADVFLQIFTFVLFYETYSYFIHRLLHTKFFSSIHYTHHKSIRVTPWSAYSVHPVEAAFIGISVPMFMYFFSLSLSIALTLHVLGMIFTIGLHSNIQVKTNSRLTTAIFSYPNYHATHHLKGKGNFGFVNSFWDKLFKTTSNQK